MTFGQMTVVQMTFGKMSQRRFVHLVSFIIVPFSLVPFILFMFILVPIIFNFVSPSSIFTSFVYPISVCFSSRFSQLPYLGVPYLLVLHLVSQAEHGPVAGEQRQCLVQQDLLQLSSVVLFQGRSRVNRTKQRGQGQPN